MKEEMSDLIETLISVLLNEFYWNISVSPRQINALI